MADKVIQFGATSPFGNFTGWEPQGATVEENKSRATALNDKGDEISASLYDTKTEVSCKYICNSDTNTIPSEIGSVLEGYVLTSISIETSADAYATMTLTGHKHSQNSHETLRKAQHGITLTKAFGVVDFTGDSEGTNDSPISSSVTISCEHVDQIDKDGNHLVGENYGGKIEVKTTYLGDHTVTATGFDVTVKSNVDENTGFFKKEVTAIKKLQLS